MYQLVVMGNGFDKSCGLQSGFNDFFRSRHDEKDVFCDSWKELSNTQTLWDVVLEAKKRSSMLWCDVEAALHQSLIPSLRNNGFSQIEQSFRKLNSTGLVLEADRLYDYLRSINTFRLQRPMLHMAMPLISCMSSSVSLNNILFLRFNALD